MLVAVDLVVTVQQELLPTQEVRVVEVMEEDITTTLDKTKVAMAQVILAVAVADLVDKLVVVVMAVLVSLLLVTKE